MYLIQVIKSVMLDLMLLFVKLTNAYVSDHERAREKKSQMETDLAASREKILKIRFVMR